MNDHLDRLHAAASTDDRAERTLRVAAVLSEALSVAGAQPVLVGGGAVEIYTRSAYTTHDLDFIAALTDAAREEMARLGFVREGRHWVHADLAIVVEFPSGALAPARAVSIDVDGYALRVIAVEDLIVDRLASWKHWGWDADGAAAAILLAVHADLDHKRLERRARDEEVSDALEALTRLAARADPITAEELHRIRGSLNARSRP